MTITERVAAAAFRLAYGPYWCADVEVHVGKMMLADARANGHRRGMPPSPPKTNGQGVSVTDAGRLALEMLAKGVRTRDVAAATGLHPSHVSRMRTDMLRRSA